MGKAKWGAVAAIAVAVVLLILAGLKLSSQEAKQAQAPVGDTASGSVAQGQGVDTSTQSTGGSGGSEKKTGGASEGETKTAGAGGDEVAEQAGDELQQEAESFVRELTESSGEPMPLTQAEGFVGPDRPLSPEAETASESAAGEVATTQGAATQAPGAAEEQGTVQAGSPIATAPQTPQPEVSAAAQGQVPQPSASGQATQDESTQPEASGAQNAREVTVNLPLSEEAPITIADILKSQTEVRPDAVYYVHTVRDGDSQGIWGIVQEGVLGNFAQGVAVRRGGTLNTYRVDIPPGADELEPDNSSSFLGRLIYEKSRESYVYNFKTGRIGQNPDLITPGQELVIVSFTPEELIEIYKHFADQRG